MMFLAFAKDLGIDDDLVFFIDGGDAIIALDGPFAGGHPGTFVIGDVTFYFPFYFAFAHPWAC